MQIKLTSILTFNAAAADADNGIFVCLNKDKEQRAASNNSVWARKFFEMKEPTLCSSEEQSWLGACVCVGLAGRKNIRQS